MEMKMARRLLNSLEIFIVLKDVIYIERKGYFVQLKWIFFCEEFLVK